MRKKSNNGQKIAALLIAAIIATSVTVGMIIVTSPTSAGTPNPTISDHVVMSPALKIHLLTPTPNPMRQQWAHLIADNLNSIGIQAEVDVADWPEIYSRALTPDPSMVGKTYEQGGFDTLFVGYMLGPDPNPYSMYSNTQYAPSGSNYYLWNDSTNEAILNNITTTTDPAKQLAAVKQWQAYAYDQLPSIAIAYGDDVNAFAKNVNGSIFAPYQYPNWPAIERWQYTSAPSTSITVAQTGPAGSDGISLSPAHTSSYYDTTVFAPIFGEGGGYGLMKRQPGNQPNPWTMVPYMANSTIAQPNYHYPGAPVMNYTFTMYRNIMFHDGTPLDGRDVVWTMRYVMTPQWGSPYCGYDSQIIGSNKNVYWAGEPGSPGASEPLDVYKVHFNLTKPWAFFMSDIGGFPIYPSEVLVNSSNYNSVNIGNWAPNIDSVTGFSSTSFGTGLNVPYFYYNKSGSLVTRIGPFGAGPYMYAGYDTTNFIHHLVKYNNYFRHGVLESQGFYQIQNYNVEYIAGSTAGVAALKAGSVQVLDAQYHLERNMTVLDPAWSNYVAYSAFVVQEMGFNMRNPILGTGLSTPLGQSNPSRAAEAAKHVRRAIEYMVPKDYIIKNIMGGLASYGVTSAIAPITPGFNKDIVLRNETMANAKILAIQELRAAGYNFLPSGGLSIHVINTQGTPIYNASVISTTQPALQAPLSGYTNSSGNIGFTNVFAGNYTVKVSKSGYPDKYASATVIANQTTSITVTLQSPMQLSLSTDKSQYALNESTTITARFLYMGQPVSMAITSVEVRDPSNSTKYISTNQTNQSGACSFRFTISPSWQKGYYTAYGVSYKDGIGRISAQTTFKVVKLISDVRMGAIWAYNPSWSSLTNNTLGPLGHYWALGGIMNMGNGSAFVSRIAFSYPTGLSPNYVQAILGPGPGSFANISYARVNNTINVYNLTLPAGWSAGVIVDINVTNSASYTSVTNAKWQDTHFSIYGSGAKSMTLNAVWDTSNPVIIDSFKIVGPLRTGTYLNVSATLRNPGSLPVTFVCIVQVIDSRGTPLSPVMQWVTLAPGQSLPVMIKVPIPSSSPKGTYTINFSLFTNLPSNGGHAINYAQTTATIR